MSDDQPDEATEQLQPEETLDDRGVDDVLDEGYSPAERWSTAMRRGPDHVDSLDERLAEEQPDTTSGTGGDVLDDGEVGEHRSGRLLAPDEGSRPDEEGALLGDDVGIDGAAASAEEAAVHTVDDQDDDSVR